MTENSKHIIAYVIFIGVSIPFVLGTNNVSSIDNVVFAVSVASLFISLSDLFETWMSLNLNPG